MLTRLVKNTQGPARRGVRRAGPHVPRRHHAGTSRTDRPMPDELRAQVLPLPPSRGPAVAAARGRRGRRRSARWRRTPQPGRRAVVISTGDRDMAQLCRRAGDAGQHDDRQLLDRVRASRSRRSSTSTRADRRLPGAGRRHLRQHPGRAEGRAEDRHGAWLNEYTTLDNSLLAHRAIEGKVGESLRASLTASSCRGGSRRSTATSLPMSPRERDRRARTSDGCARCTRGSNCARC